MEAAVVLPVDGVEGVEVVQEHRGGTVHVVTLPTKKLNASNVIPSTV